MSDSTIPKPIGTDTSEESGFPEMLSNQRAAPNLLGHRSHSRLFSADKIDFPSELRKMQRFFSSILAAVFLTELSACGDPPVDRKADCLALGDAKSGVIGRYDDGDPNTQQGSSYDQTGRGELRSLPARDGETTVASVSLPGDVAANSLAFIFAQANLQPGPSPDVPPFAGARSEQTLVHAGEGECKLVAQPKAWVWLPPGQDATAEVSVLLPSGAVESEQVSFQVDPNDIHKVIVVPQNGLTVTIPNPGLWVREPLEKTVEFTGIGQRAGLRVIVFAGGEQSAVLLVWSHFDFR